ncbi:hypothetical protein CHS0354_005919, partial [Potamilus streckersoni]
MFSPGHPICGEGHITGFLVYRRVCLQDYGLQWVKPGRIYSVPAATKRDKPADITRHCIESEHNCVRSYHVNMGEVPM